MAPFGMQLSGLTAERAADHSRGYACAATREPATLRDEILFVAAILKNPGPSPRMIFGCRM
jgi:hypothetical protein